MRYDRRLVQRSWSESQANSYAKCTVLRTRYTQDRTARLCRGAHQCISTPDLPDTSRLRSKRAVFSARPHIQLPSGTIFATSDLVPGSRLCSLFVTGPAPSFAAAAASARVCRSTLAAQRSLPQSVACFLVILATHASHLFALLLLILAPLQLLSSITDTPASLNFKWQRSPLSEASSPAKTHQTWLASGVSLAVVLISHGPPPPSATQTTILCKWGYVHKTRWQPWKCEQPKSL